MAQAERSERRGNCSFGKCRFLNDPSRGSARARPPRFRGRSAVAARHLSTGGTRGVDRAALPRDRPWRKRGDRDRARPSRPCESADRAFLRSDHRWRRGRKTRARSAPRREGRETTMAPRREPTFPMEKGSGAPLRAVVLSRGRFDGDRQCGSRSDGDAQTGVGRGRIGPRSPIPPLRSKGSRDQSLVRLLNLLCSPSNGSAPIDERSAKCVRATLRADRGQRRLSDRPGDSQQVHLSEVRTDRLRPPVGIEQGSIGRSRGRSERVERVCARERIRIRELHSTDSMGTCRKRGWPIP